MNDCVALSCVAPACARGRGLEGNRLGGVVPALPFAQYTGYCGLQLNSSATNHFVCPLPEGAEACHKCSDATCVAPSCVTTVCVGASAGLAPADCAAWVDIYDATKGSQWAGCSGNRLDPCGCTAKDPDGAPRVACTSDKTHITQL